MKTFSIKEVFKKGWISTKNNFWFLVLSTSIFLVVSAVLDKTGKGPDSFLVFIASMIVSMLFSIGMYRISLNLGEDKKPEVSDFKTTPDVFLSVLWASIISSFFTFIGFILLIVPGIIIALRLSMTTYILLDKKIGAFDAVKESWRMTKGFSLKIFLAFLAFISLVIVSAIPFGLGLPLVIPYIYITGGVIYKKIKSSDGLVVVEEV